MIKFETEPLYIFPSVENKLNIFFFDLLKPNLKISDNVINISAIVIYICIFSDILLGIFLCMGKKININDTL